MRAQDLFWTFFVFLWCACWQSGWLFSNSTEIFFRSTVHLFSPQMASKIIFHVCFPFPSKHMFEIFKRKFTMKHWKWLSTGVASHKTFNSFDSWLWRRHQKWRWILHWSLVTEFCKVCTIFSIIYHTFTNFAAFLFCLFFGGAAFCEWKIHAKCSFIKYISFARMFGSFQTRKRFLWSRYFLWIVLCIEDIFVLKVEVT